MQNITFEGIKQSLIEYYSSQDEFKDFNWTAPAITTLIDAQTYLAHYLCTYANFALNESFLDTAQKRSSVVSKARNIGYYPEQYKTSIASLKLLCKKHNQGVIGHKSMFAKEQKLQINGHKTKKAIYNSFCQIQKSIYLQLQ